MAGTHKIEYWIKYDMAMLPVVEYLGCTSV